MFLHQILMARNVYDSDLNLAVRRRQRELREAKVDCHTSRFFLGQTIRVRARQCLHECALPVINVAGSRENEILLAHCARKGFAKKTKIEAMRS